MYQLKHIILVVEAYRKQIRGKYYQKYSEEFERKKKEGNFPFEGKWVAVNEISKLQKRLKKKDRIIFYEILFLYLLTGIITWGLYQLFVWLFLPK